MISPAIQGLPALRLLDYRTSGDAGACDLSAFRTRCNAMSFPFRHKLHSHALFEWPSLLDLAATYPRDDAHLYCSCGPITVTDRWSAHQQSRFEPTAVLDALSETDSLLMFKRLDEDERFGPLIRSIQEELLELTGAWLRDDIVVGRGTLLVASPGRITSYHMDSDINFLFQIKGKKTFNVTEAGERGAVSQQELEHFFLGDPNAAHYDEARQQRSTVYELGAGDGVHVPCLSPHWAQNHDSPSVALSINFDLRSIVSVGRIYRLNGRLRRWGLMPYPPRVSHWRDQLKLAALNALHHRPS